MQLINACKEMELFSPDGCTGVPTHSRRFLEEAWIEVIRTYQVANF